MPEFMLLLHDRPGIYRAASPRRMQEIIERYRAWSHDLSAKGRLVGGHKLTDDDGKVLGPGTNGVLVKDGPYSETKEVVGGYFLIEAADYADAVEISRGCPHLEFGGYIELRQIDKR